MKFWARLKNCFELSQISDIANLEGLSSEELIKYLERPITVQLGNRVVLELIKRLFEMKK